MLRATTPSFVPKQKLLSAPVFVPKPIRFADDLIYSILVNLTDYYIKGGKAFHYYYPRDIVGEYVPSMDFDLVATEETCTLLFSLVTNMCFGESVLLETYSDPMLVEQITETRRVYKDKVDSSSIKNCVRTLSINDIGLIDVIIVESISEEEFQVEVGIRYMNRVLFRSDLEQVYTSRRKNVHYKNEKSQEKARKSERRVLVSRHFQGRKSK